MHHLIGRKHDDLRMKHCYGQFIRKMYETVENYDIHVHCAKSYHSRINVKQVVHYEDIYKEQMLMYSTQNKGRRTVSVEDKKGISSNSRTLWECKMTAI